MPAMKLARKEGIQVVLITFPKRHCSHELVWHSDFKREMVWPAQ